MKKDNAEVTVYSKVEKYVDSCSAKHPPRRWRGLYPRLFRASH